MKSDREKLVLLSVAGMTPQVITETLQALIVDAGELVDEVQILTTASAYPRLREALLGNGDGAFHRFCQDFGIDAAGILFRDPDSFRVLKAADGVTDLVDVRTNEEYVLAADQICEWVREAADRPNTRLHASIAGGRKSMGVYLLAAMQLFARSADRVSHVLVDGDSERNRDFYYKPPTNSPRHSTVELVDDTTGERRVASTQDAQIELSDVPFLRLRRVLSSWPVESSGRFADLVSGAQRELEHVERALTIRFDGWRSNVIVGQTSVKLAQREFLLYILFAVVRVRNGHANGFVALGDLRTSDFDEAYRCFTRMRGHEEGLEAAGDLHPRLGCLAEYADALEGDNVERYEDTMQRLREALSRLNNKLGRAGVPPERFGVSPRRGAEGTVYGVSAPRELILGLDS